MANSQWPQCYLESYSQILGYFLESAWFPWEPYLPLFYTLNSTMLASQLIQLFSGQPFSDSLGTSCPLIPTFSQSTNSLLVSFPDMSSLESLDHYFNGTLANVLNPFIPSRSSSHSSCKSQHQMDPTTFCISIPGQVNVAVKSPNRTP